MRLVVFDGAARSPAYFFNEKVMCGLGAGMSETGHLNPTGRERAMAALRRFALLAEGMGAGPLSAVATAAVREATDGPDFAEQVLRETGIRLYVIDGPEEARLSAQGVLLGWPGAYGLVCDMGGSSMELAEIEGGRVGRCVSSDLGPLKLRDLKGGKKARKARIRARSGSAGPARRAEEPAVSRRRVMAGHRQDRHGPARLSAARAPRVPDERENRARHGQVHRKDRRRHAQGALGRLLQPHRAGALMRRRC